MIDRREFSTILALAAAAGVVRPRALFGAAQSATVFEWETIGDGLNVAFGAGGNVLAIADGGSLMLIDTKNAGYGQALQVEAEGLGGTLEAVVNTHHHPDHIGGNPFFDVPIIGQARGVDRAAAWGEGAIGGIAEDPVGSLQSMVQRVRDMDISSEAKQTGSDSVAAYVAMVEDLGPADFAATETFDTELSRTVGGVAVELRHIDRGHTDNDAFVFLPAANVLHGGDLFFNGIHPRIDVGSGATTHGWQRCLDAMIEAADDSTVCIPGHGPLSDVDGLRDFRGYFDILRAFVQEHIDAGSSRDQIMEMQPAQFRDWPTARLNQNLGIIYDEITG